MHNSRKRNHKQVDEQSHIVTRKKLKAATSTREAEGGDEEVEERASAATAMARKLQTHLAKVNLQANTAPPYTIIAFDLQTTGLFKDYPDGSGPHITQIAADVWQAEGESFNVYVKPKVPITSFAQELTGIRMTTNGGMKVGDKAVNALGVRKAIKRFCRWLNRFEKVCLVAHCGLDFDFKIMLRVAKNANELNRFNSCVTALVDSVEIFRFKYKGMDNSMKGLVLRVLRKKYNKLNATVHTSYLNKLFDAVPISQEQVLTYTFKIENVKY